MLYSSIASWYRHVGDMHSLRTTTRIHFTCVTFVYSNHSYDQSRVLSVMTKIVCFLSYVHICLVYIPGMSKTLIPKLIAGQVLLYFNGWFSSCFFSLAICTYAYKAWHYYYPSGALELELRWVEEMVAFFRKFKIQNSVV